MDKSRLQAAFTGSPKNNGASAKSGTRWTDPVDQLEGNEAMRRLEGAAAGLDFDAPPRLTDLSCG